MAKGDILPFETTYNKQGGSLKFAVAAGTTASINAGEPVQKLAGAAYATAAQNNMPTATLRHVGISASNSTETASADGTVDVIPAVPGSLWLVNPDVLTTWNTQAKYNALVGARVLIKLSAGVYTLLAADGAGNGAIVEYIEVAKYPGKVCVSLSPLSYYSNV